MGVVGTGEIDNTMFDQMFLEESERDGIQPIRGDDVAVNKL